MLLGKSVLEWVLENFEKSFWSFDRNLMMTRLKLKTWNAWNVRISLGNAQNSWFPLRTVNILGTCDWRLSRKTCDTNAFGMTMHGNSFLDDTFCVIVKFTEVLLQIEHLMSLPTSDQHAQSSVRSIHTWLIKIIYNGHNPQMRGLFGVRNKYGT